MGHAYASQNDLGRLCDESVYEQDLAERLSSNGFGCVRTQVPVTVSLRDFSKTYRLDLVADDAVYELKTDRAFSAEHESQVLTYMFLLGIQRAKLLNFRTPKVEGKVVATGLTPARRRNVMCSTNKWMEISPKCSALRQIMLELIHEWGAFLEVGLYKQALVHFLGGESQVEQRVRLRRGNVTLGTQRMLMLAPGVAFDVTAVTEGQENMESHLSKLLRATALNAIQWINMNHSQIEFTTVVRRARE